MKIIRTGLHSDPLEDGPVEIVDYVHKECNSDNFDRGVTEATEATVEKLCLVVGRLLDVLCSKENLSVAELVEIVEATKLSTLYKVTTAPEASTK